MARTILLNSSGAKVILEEGESANVTVTFYDLGGDALAKASIVTLTCSLINALDGTVINSREDQNILDANGGTLATSGVLTLRLEATDNAIVQASEEEIETHYLQLKWTWSDGVSTRTGIHEFEFYVRNTTLPVS